MPEANKIKKDEVMVDLDTSGPETEVSLPEEEIKEVANKYLNKNQRVEVDYLPKK